MARSAEEFIGQSVELDWDGPARRRGSESIQDTFAIGVAGMFSDQAEYARTALAGIGALSEGVQPWAAERPYDPASAAFLLGTACHGLDWDDFMHPMHGHCSAVLLPVAWTLVEQRGGGGRDLLDAFLAGYQVDYLVSLVLSHGHYYRGWHATSTSGTIGAAATAARAMALSPGQTAAALGIAASFASGLRVNFGTPTKAFHAGAAARHGVEAALLARAGATSSDRWLVGPAGMLDVMGGDTGAAEAAGVVADAVARGEHGILTAWGRVQKPYACCGSCHGAIDAVIRAVAENDLGADDIERIDLHIDPIVATIMREGVPTDSHSARYSISWAIAAAAADRAAGPAQFSNEALARRDVQWLREQVRIHLDLESSHDDRFAARVAISSRAGFVANARVSHALGHPANPMRHDDQRNKQLAALSLVMPPSVATSVAALLDDIDGIARLSDIDRELRTVVSQAGCVNTAGISRPG